MKKDHWIAGFIIGGILMTVMVSAIYGSYRATVYLGIDSNWAIPGTIMTILLFALIPEWIAKWRKAA